MELTIKAHTIKLNKINHVTPVLATGKKASLKSDVFFLFTVIIYGKICNLHFIIIAKTAF